MSKSWIWYAKLEVAAIRATLEIGCTCAARRRGELMGMEIHAFDIMYIHGDIWLYELKGLGFFTRMHVCKHVGMAGFQTRHSHNTKFGIT